MKKINRVNTLRTNLSRLPQAPKLFIFNELLDIQNGNKLRHPSIPDAFHISSAIWGDRIGGPVYNTIKEQIFIEVEGYRPGTKKFYRLKHPDVIQTVISECHLR